MRSICSIIIKWLRRALSLSLALLLCPSALATTMDSYLSLGMISVKSASLNPLAPEEREFQSLTALIYEGLFYLDDDYKPQECLARECNYTSDGKDWTIRLRQDAVFHDGTPCTAYDVEATINEILRLAQEGRGQYNQLQYIISSVSVNSADSLKITVKRPYYGVRFALTFPVLPRDQVMSSMPVGTGPFKVDDFAPANYLHLSANDNWWNGEPAVKAISVSFRATNRELISDYEYNRVDAAITRSASAGQYQTGLTNLNITYRTRQLETLLLNNSSSAFPLNDQKVREAVRCAIDFDAIANSVYMGMAWRTDTPMPVGTWMYRDSDEYGYDPDKARALLEEAGWKADPERDNGIRHTTVTVKGESKDRRLRLRLYVYEEQDNAVRLQVANKIADYLQAVGIEVAVTVANFSNVKEHLEARNFDMAIAAFQMDTVPDPGFLLMSANTGNYVGYKSQEMDKLFKSLRTAKEFDEYQSILWQIQDLFAADCPFVCMYYRGGALLTRKVFTTVRDVREPEILRGIEGIGN
jgi:peptide/nickel transport system substrate-binding protein